MAKYEGPLTEEFLRGLTDEELLVLIMDLSTYPEDREHDDVARAEWDRRHEKKGG